MESSFSCPLFSCLLWFCPAVFSQGFWPPVGQPCPSVPALAPPSQQAIACSSCSAYPQAAATAAKQVVSASSWEESVYPALLQLERQELPAVIKSKQYDLLKPTQLYLHGTDESSTWVGTSRRAAQLGKGEHPEDQTWGCAFHAGLTGWMDVVIYCIICGQKRSLALMAVTSALKLGNCHLIRAHMVFYCSHSSSREVASPRRFPRNHFSSAAQSLALHSAYRQLVCMKTPSPGSMPKSLKFLSLSSEGTWEEDFASHCTFAGDGNSRGPATGSQLCCIPGHYWQGILWLGHEVRICLQMFLNYVNKMEAINC